MLKLLQLILIISDAHTNVKFDQHFEHETYSTPLSAKNIFDIFSSKPIPTDFGQPFLYQNRTIKEKSNSIEVNLFNKNNCPNSDT